MSCAVLNLNQLRVVEREAASRLGEGVLMARAGAAAAEWIAAHRLDRTTRIAIVCGPGNNGGDGYACALELAAAGFAPTVVALAQPNAADAAAMHRRWTALHAVAAELPPLGVFDVVVDAMFGVGLSRPLGGEYLAAARAINASGAHVVALDCPSGIDAERGAWVGAVQGVIAQTTITFVAAKSGLFTGAGVDACGTVVVRTLGVEADVNALGAAGCLNGPDQFPSVCAPRRHDTHKGTYGNLAVVGGARGMVGAALLAARAALRLGAGRVYVDAIGAAEFLVDPGQPELMFRPLAQIEHVDAIVVGCGLGTGDAARGALAAAFARGATCIVDADALSLLEGPGTIGTRTMVLTPHPLEAARLLRCSAAEVQADRIAAALRLAKQMNAIVVLKGAGSVIAAAERYWINTTGTPALATAGTGDVLAGMIGALVAQGFPSIEAALAGTWLHGAAADTFGADVGLIAGDVAALAADALARIRKPRAN